MKNFIRAILVTGIIISAGAVNAQDYSSAGAYMQFFSDQYKQVSKDMWDYMSAIARGKNAKKVEARRKELLKSMLDAKRKIASAKPYKDDSALRDSMVAFLQINYSVLHEDYDKIVDMEEIAEESYDLMETYINTRRKANEKLNEASAALDDAQQRFGIAHNITIIQDESRLGKKLSRAGKAFDYYDDIYLIFFKAQIQESNMVIAMNKGDMNAMEQSKNSLKQFSVEGLETLKTYKSYQGDASLIVACKNLFMFYKNEAETKAPVLIDFYLKKENYDKMKAAMVGKEKTASREEIEKYNNSLKEYNTLISSFNSTNNELNKERGQKLNAWNDAIKTFLDKQAS